MRILLDTHIILWALTNDYRLSQKARDIIEAADNEIYYSVISLWEIELKRLLHKREMPLTGTAVSSYCRDAGYIELGLLDAHIFALENLHRQEIAQPHKDPFDKILLCQAKEEKMRFLTHDKLLLDYDVPDIIHV